MNGLLSLLIFLPVVGTLVVLFVPREKTSVIQWVTTLFAGAEFLLSVPLWTFAGFRKSGDFFFRETHDWIPSLGAKYSLGVDGIAALLILLTTLLSFISVYCVVHGDHEAREGVLRVPPPPRDGDGRRLLRARLLPLLRVLGSDARADVLPHRHLGRPAQALRRDQVLPVHARRARSSCCSRSSRSTSSTRPASCGGRASGTPPTFDIVHFQTIASSIPPDLQLWLFWAFFIGFAIKVPMFPFHTWLPDAHVEAPTAGSVILAGVLLKMGTYGFLRFSLPICPDASPRRALLGSRPSAGSRPVDHRHRLRLDGRDGPEGHEEARRVLVGRAPRLRHARPLRAEQRRASRAGSCSRSTTGSRRAGSSSSSGSSTSGRTPA